jgi:hypothetical protein
MTEGCSFVGLIEYQRKPPYSCVHVLCVINPYVRSEEEKNYL